MKISKNLDQYIKEYIQSNWKYKLPEINGYRTFTEFCDINNLSENELTEEQVNFYYTYNINDKFNRYDVDYEYLTSNKNIFDSIRHQGLCLYHITKVSNKRLIEKKEV